MTNDAPAPFPGGASPDPATTGSILKVVIGALIGTDASLPMKDLVLPSDFTTSIDGTKVSMTDIPAIEAALTAANLPPIRVRTRTLTEDANKIV